MIRLVILFMPAVEAGRLMAQENVDIIFNRHTLFGPSFIYRKIPLAYDGLSVLLLDVPGTRDNLINAKTFGYIA
jgi:hypothetical protein